VRQVVIDDSGRLCGRKDETENIGLYNAVYNAHRRGGERIAESDEIRRSWRDDVEKSISRRGERLNLTMTT
jgi:hypothetical protein